MPSQSLILSKELKKRVAEKVIECLKIAEKEYEQKFKVPQINYDLRNTHGGMAYSGEWKIRLNPILLYENQDHFVEHTVPHEVAHLVARQVYPPKPGQKRIRSHGREWKSVMAVFKLPPKVTHSYNCASIERPKRKSGGARPGPTLDRIFKQAIKLSEDDIIKLTLMLQSAIDAEEES